MYWQKINLIYFSATGTTTKIISAVAEGLAVTNKVFYRLTATDQLKKIDIPSDEISIFAFPVFSGRLPFFIPQALKKFKGNSSPAILICMYGNRHFDDALLELKNTVEMNGFCAISAAAFIGQHSIFPGIGKGKPDLSDLEIAKNFGINNLKILENLSSIPDFSIPGEYPYRETKKIPFHPHSSHACNHCSLCAKNCPTRAINPANPKELDKAKCISCGACIYVCPKQARKFDGILYRLVSQKFKRNFSSPKAPYLIYCKEI